MRLPIRLPAAARNPVSLVGIAIATAMAWVFLALFALDLLGYLDNPYIGLVLFVAIPAAFMAGLLLIPIGVRRSVGGRWAWCLTGRCWTCAIRTSDP